MRNQKGITLVALVVTIVVLLILAGTSIAMLKGDNGIITNAQAANYSNTEGEAMDKIKLAFNTITTSVMVNGATDTSYNPTTEKSLVDLANLALKDLGETGTITFADGTKKYKSYTSDKKDGHYYVEVDSEVGTITIGYQDKYFKSKDIATSEAVADGAKYKEVRYVITVTSDKATLGNYEKQVKTNN